MGNGGLGTALLGGLGGDAGLSVGRSFNFSPGGGGGGVDLAASGSVYTGLEGLTGSTPSGLNGLQDFNFVSLIVSTTTFRIRFLACLLIRRLPPTSLTHWQPKTGILTNRHSTMLMRGSHFLHLVRTSLHRSVVCTDACGRPGSKRIH